MADKFIPEGDLEFACMARNFAVELAREPERFGASVQEAQSLSQAVEEFRDALSAALRKQTRSALVVSRKNDARAKAVRLIRTLAKRIRANESIGAIDKLKIGMCQRAARPKRGRCPSTPPILLYRGRTGGMQTSGRKHVLRFYEEFGKRTRAKPAGAARVELFVELIAPGEKVPHHPGPPCSGQGSYVRSFTRNPIEVEVTVPHQPMMVVYWARWADSTGNVGPFSTPCRADYEGCFDPALALPDQTQARRREQRIVITSARLELPDHSRELEEDQVDEQMLLPDARVA